MGGFDDINRKKGRGRGKKTEEKGKKED